MDNENFYLNLLFKKWELLYNHYKFQDEMHEKRRHFLWIMQVFIFTAWYYTKNCNNLFFIIINAFIPFIGIFVNIALIFVLNRHWRSILLTEQALRDAEKQMINQNSRLYMDRFLLDRKVFWDGKNYIWPHTSEEYKRECFPYLFSATLWLNKIIPGLFVFIWFSMAILNIIRVCKG